MPLQYAQEITRLHKLYIQGKFDPLTVETDHKTIRAHQRNKTAVAGRVGEAVSDADMWGLVFQETLQEYQEIESNAADDRATVPLSGASEDPYSGPFSDLVHRNGTADGRYGTVVRGGLVARVQCDRPLPTAGSGVCGACAGCGARVRGCCDVC